MREQLINDVRNLETRELLEREFQRAKAVILENMKDPDYPEYGQRRISMSVSFGPKPNKTRPCRPYRALVAVECYPMLPPRRSRADELQIELK